MREFQPKHLIIIVFVSFVGFIWFLMHIGHTPEFNTESKKNLFFFKDSILNKINTLSSSNVAEHDIINSYLYYEDIKDKRPYYLPEDTSYNNYYIDIWEFKNLVNYKLEDATINTSSAINRTEFDFGETLDPKGYCPISIKYFYKIDGININLSEDSKVIKEIQGKRYKGFYGLIVKMSICNNNGEPQVYFSFKKAPRPTILLLYKGYPSFYLIKINSSKRIDESIIKILNLD